jgi:hypothetical protein
MIAFDSTFNTEVSLVQQQQQGLDWNEATRVTSLLFPKCCTMIWNVQKSHGDL